jgi:hypothetical protein
LEFARKCGEEGEWKKGGERGRGKYHFEFVCEGKKCGCCGGKRGKMFWWSVWLICGFGVWRFPYTLEAQHVIQSQNLREFGP